MSLHCLKNKKPTMTKRSQFSALGRQYLLCHTHHPQSTYLGSSTIPGYSLRHVENLWVHTGSPYFHHQSANNLPLIGDGVGKWRHRNDYMGLHHGQRVQYRVNENRNSLSSHDYVHCGQYRQFQLASGDSHDRRVAELNFIRHGLRN